MAPPQQLLKCSSLPAQFFGIGISSKGSSEGNTWNGHSFAGLYLGFHLAQWQCLVLIFYTRHTLRVRNFNLMPLMQLGQRNIIIIKLHQAVSDFGFDEESLAKTNANCAFSNLAFLTIVVADEESIRRSCVCNLKNFLDEGVDRCQELLQERDLPQERTKERSFGVSQSSNRLFSQPSKILTELWFVMEFGCLTGFVMLSSCSLHTCGKPRNRIYMQLISLPRINLLMAFVTVSLMINHAVLVFILVLKR